MQATIDDIDVTTLTDDWEGLTSAGREIAAASDRNRWALGDIAIKAERRYGEASIAKLAMDIGLPAAKTLYDYHRVSKFYPVDFRHVHPSLSWSHYRTAVKLKDVEEALEWLDKAADNNWPVAKLNEEIVGPNTKPKRAVFEVSDVSGLHYGNSVMDARRLSELIEQYRKTVDFTVEIVVKYHERAVA